jgi:hypothetical protein
MAIALNTQQDFATILDGAEPVTVRRWNSPETISVTAAWRYASKMDEVEIGSGDYARHDVIWQLPWDPSDEGPRLGDLVIDAAGECWTIITVERLRLDTRYKCLARNLLLAFGLDTQVDVQLADVTDLSSRPESVNWITLQAAVPARILQDNTKVSFDPGDAEEEIDPAYTSKATYRIILGEQIELDHNHRLVDAQGAVYDVVEFAHFGRIDRLPMATVVKQPATS